MNNKALCKVPAQAQLTLAFSFQCRCSTCSTPRIQTASLSSALQEFGLLPGRSRLFLAIVAVIAFFASGSNVATAQITQGVIHYELTTDMHRSIPANRAELRNFIPQYRTDHFTLYFNAEATAYKPRIEQPQEVTAGGGGIRVVMRSPRVETHVERNTRVRTVSLDFMGRNILIVDTIGNVPWRFGRETMQIAGYTAMMAWYNDTVNNVEVTAWFTPQLPPLQGPDRFVTLPGTVLAVDINNGERVWVARSIEGREITPEELTIYKPGRAEIMTRQQFNAFLEAQMQRMNQNAPGSGAMLRMFAF